jgi:hypothetical protein
MTVYVDDMHLNPLGQLKHLRMCHMIADNEDELHAMAARIGVARGWYHKAGTPRSHYDIDAAKRVLALEAGAIEITMRECAVMTMRRGVEGVLGTPAETMAWWKQRMRSGG